MVDQCGVGDLPQVDTSTLTSKTEFNELEENLYGGDPQIPVYRSFRNNVVVNPDAVGQTANGGYYLGLGTSTSGIIYAAANFPAGTYTFYVKLRFSEKGDLHSLAYFRGTTTLGFISQEIISTGHDFSFVFTTTYSADVVYNNIVAQLRSRYGQPISNPASLTIVEISAFQGALTKEEIEESRQAVIDKTKVLKSKEADVAYRALVAETVESMPADYVDSVESRVDKVAGKFEDSIVEWNGVAGSTTNFIDRTEGKLHVGGTVTGFTGSTGNHRLWFGMDIRPAFSSL